MIRLLLVVALLLAVVGAGVAAGQVKHADDRFYEVDHAAGRGGSVAEALLRAREDAVDRTALALFAQTEDERSRYRAARSQLLEDLDALAPDLRLVDKYREGGEVVVAVRGTVRRQELRQRLLTLGVIRELDQVLSGADLPRVVVLVSPGSESQELAEFAAGRMNDRLTAQRLAVVDAGTLGKLAAGDRLAIGTGDQARPEMAAAQADIVLVLSVGVRHASDAGDLALYQADVRIESYLPGMVRPLAVESYRSRELAFRTGEDRVKAQRACVEEAVGGAMEPLAQTLLRAVKEERTLGRLYTLKVVGSAPRVRHLEEVLRSGCRAVESAPAPGGAVITVRYDGKLEDLVADLASRPSLGLEVRSEAARSAELRLAAPR